MHLFPFPSFFFLLITVMGSICRVTNWNLLVYQSTINSNYIAWHSSLFDDHSKQNKNSPLLSIDIIPRSLSRSLSWGLVCHQYWKILPTTTTTLYIYFSFVYLLCLIILCDIQYLIYWPWLSFLELFFFGRMDRLIYNRFVSNEQFSFS